jgi:hypothetical protein
LIVSADTVVKVVIAIFKGIHSADMSRTPGIIRRPRGTDSKRGIIAVEPKAATYFIPSIVGVNNGFPCVKTRKTWLRSVCFGSTKGSTYA